jgi:head-tail adaptor
MEFPFGETVTRQRGVATTDPYSNESTSVDWTTPATLAIPNCAVADGGSLEPVQNARNSVESDFDVVLPFGSDVRATDRLVVRGLVCEIQGRPFDWLNPFTGWEAGMVAKCKVVEG